MTIKPFPIPVWRVLVRRANGHFVYTYSGRLRDAEMNAKNNKEMIVNAELLNEDDIARAISEYGVTEECPGPAPCNCKPGTCESVVYRVCRMASEVARGDAS